MNTALILAAGRGERLKPLTNYIPKALCKVDGLPLIEHHVQRLAQQGFTRIVINHAYFGDQIRRCLGDGQRFGLSILYSPEPPGALETGGGIYNALPLLGEQPFLTVNADIVTDFPFASLTLPTQALVHLVLVNNPAHNAGGDFGFNEDHWLNNQRHYTFPGIACYHPQAFARAKPGRYSVVPLLRQLTNEQAVSGQLFEGLWMDIGSMERLVQVNELKACMA